MLAAELSLRDVKVVVLERLAEPDVTIKAGAIGALAGEALERRGFGPAMDAEENVLTEAMRAMAKRNGAPGNLLQGPSPLNKIGGHFAGLIFHRSNAPAGTEAALTRCGAAGLGANTRRGAGKRGVEVRRSCEVVDFREEGDGVTVEGQGPSGAFSLHCGYLVGCDGGRSMLRKRAGFEFPGTDPTLTGHQAIVELDHPERLLPLGWRRTAKGMLAYGPVPGRVLTVEFDGPPADRDTPVTAEEVESSVRNLSGADVTITSMKSATRFTDNARQATTYRRGRSLVLAGDAAHVHSPFGGQGLNLGLLDAVNLGWKLASVVRGAVAEELLETYTAERHPVAARALANTRAQVALMRPDALTTALRDIVAGIHETGRGQSFLRRNNERHHNTL